MFPSHANGSILRELRILGMGDRRLVKRAAIARASLGLAIAAGLAACAGTVAPSVSTAGMPGALEPVHAAAFTRAGAFVRAAQAFQHRDQVVAVHLQAVQATSQAFLRQCLRASLRLAWHADRPAVVDHAQHHRQGIGTGGIHRGVEIRLR